MKFLSAIFNWFKPKPPEPTASRLVRVYPTSQPERWAHLRVFSDGIDLYVEGTATAFGGDSDKLDNGETASGFNTKGNAGLIAVALPMSNNSLFDKKHGYVLKGSPIPKMPFGLFASGKRNPKGAFVDVTFPGDITVRDVPVIDLGPANWTGDCLDCSVALAKKYKGSATANNFSTTIRYRIHGGAKYLS